MAVRPLAVAVPHAVVLVAFLVNVPAVQIVAIGLLLVDGVVVSVQSVTALQPLPVPRVHPVSAAGQSFLTPFSQYVAPVHCVHVADAVLFPLIYAPVLAVTAYVFASHPLDVYFIVLLVLVAQYVGTVC